MDNVEVIRVGAGATVVALHGEHDAMTRDSLAGLLATEISGNELVVVDVSDADFVDSSFLHNVIKGDRLARGQGSRLVLQMGTTRNVRSAIDVSGILGSIEWAGSRDDALGHSTHNAHPHLATVAAHG